MLRVRSATGLALGTLVLLALAGAVNAQDTISFAGKEDVSVTIEDGAGSATVVVVNGGDAATIDWTVQLAPGEDGAVRTATVDPAQSSLATRSTNTIALTIKDVSATGKLSGVLVGTPTGAGSPITRTLTISNFGLAWSMDAAAIVLVVLVLSLAVLTGRYLTLDRRTIKGPLKDPKWDYTTTWTAGFAGAGALLATLVASGSLPPEPYLLTKAEFAGLAMLFGALGILAPVIFTALNRPRGFIEVFHFSTWLSTAAVIGQLTTILLLLVDATGQGSSDWFVVSIGVMQVVGVVLIYIYIWRGVPKTLEDAQSTTGVAPGMKPATWTML